MDASVFYEEGLRMSKRNKIFIGCGIAVAVTIIIAVCLSLFNKEGSSAAKTAYVAPVSELGGMVIGGGSSNRYAGIVESMDVWKVDKNAESTVKEIHVAAGDQVKVGDPLFSYDAEEFAAQLTQAEIDLERQNNELDSIKKTITQLQKDKKEASKSDQAYYTIQIQEQELAQRQKELDIQAQNQKIDKLRENVNNATVYSEVDGVVKSVSTGEDESMYQPDNDSSFISIIRNGELRVRSTINEQNVGDLVEGDAVTVWSRVDPNVSWKGTVTKIDYESAQNSSNMYGYSDAMTTSSNYPFYVELVTSDGMMMGQHVYLEKDKGLDERAAGLWLEEYLIVNAPSGNPFVWADNGKGRIEKRPVTLGEHDEDLMSYLILAGLSEDDLIAVPDDKIVAGMKTAPMTDMMPVAAGGVTEAVG